METDKQRKVLAIDDDPTNLLILKSLLHKMDLVPILQQCPEKGIECALRDQPDIILLDIMMPGIDGYEVCRRLKADPYTASIPVIFLSAKCDSDDIVRGLELGAVDYMTKPLRFGELKARIGTVRNMLYLQEKMALQANTDHLTGLPNRALFLDRLGFTLARAQRSPQGLFGVLYLDLDKFKTINDSLGHQYGDQLLVEVAQRLSQCVRSADTLARMGGDEFAILLDSVKDFSGAIAIAERIQEALQPVVSLGEHNLSVTSSIGIVLSATGQVKPEIIIRDADTAMYRSKERGGNCYELFDPVMQEQAQRRYDLKRELQRALRQEELILHYQPIVELQTGRIWGFEALLRWQHPARGLIMPAEFIDLAEETGLIIPIGQWVLEKACRQIQLWKRQFSRQLSISVNLSVKQLAYEEILEQIRRALQETDLAPNLLHLEITESLLVKDPELAIMKLVKLKNMGVGLSLDDFGTGYSSLSSLHTLPVDRLKIDRSFVNRIPGDNNGGKIVQTVVWLAKHLGMDPVAEGIETPEQLHYLKEIGCRYGQGYFLAKPIAAQDAELFLAPLATASA